MTTPDTTETAGQPTALDDLTTGALAFRMGLALGRIEGRLDALIARTKPTTQEDTMPTTTPAFQIGTDVTINAHPGDVTQIPAQAAVITAINGEYRFCQSCHCTPPNPEHRADASDCCPGPWYLVEYGCPEAPHTHSEVYAEHELTRAE